MFGAYQAGAYAVIAEKIKFDMVVGTSVGALNGWPIAAGCSPEELIARWINPVTGNALRLVPNPGFRNGWFDPVPLRTLTEELVAQYTPRIPFTLVTLALPLLKTTIVSHPNVTADYLRASGSIPYFLPIVEIDGKKFMDGGVFEKTPVQVAVKLGATRIIAVDCLTNITPAIYDVAMRVARSLRPQPALPPGTEITWIEPSEIMGSLYDAVFWKETNVRRWIEMGRADALRIL